MLYIRTHTYMTLQEEYIKIIKLFMILARTFSLLAGAVTWYRMFKKIQELQRIAKSHRMHRR